MNELILIELSARCAGGWSMIWPCAGSRIQIVPFLLYSA